MIQSPSEALSIASCSPAALQAQQNWTSNLTAIRATQPHLQSIAAGPDEAVEWLFARDGSLTAMLADGHWWAGCSVPRAAARFMLKKMEAGGNVACFLAPSHAAQLRLALDKLEPQQAVVAIVPDPGALWVILHGEDFSTDIAAHRLWFAAGEKWETELERLFVEHSGLPTPAQFIRPVLADSEPADRLIAPAQRIFTAEGQRRLEQTRQLVAKTRGRSAVRRVCVLAPSRFRLWDPAPSTLARVAEGADDNDHISRFDSDDPASASPLALASAIADSDAILAANVARSDAPDVAPRELPWVTWVTTPRLPSGEAAGPNDQLLLADPQWRTAALKCGWPADRIHMAGWPRIARGPCPMGSPLVLMADTQSLAPPKKVEDFSSHKLLWEMIADELLHDPFAIGDDADKYLRNRMSRLQIAEAGFDRAVFFDSLIVPAFGQGIARLLIREALPLKIYGKGWDQIEPISSTSCGSVRAFAQFEQIVNDAAGLVHAWPSRHVHPIGAVGRPVLWAFSKHRESFLREARMVMTGSSVSTGSQSCQPLSWDLIAPLLI